MFGYIKIDKGELLVKEYETYKSVYCGLCRQIGKEYSFLSRFLLSYDCTFYAIILLSLNKSCNGFIKKRCVCNPLKKCVYCKTDNDNLSKAAALNIILAYYKLNDDIYDSGNFRKFSLSLLKPVFSHWYRKARKKYSELDKIAGKMMESQQAVESKKDFIFDEACHPTAEMLGTVLSLESDNDSTKRILYQMGYSLGRFIYIIDAVDDFIEDRKKGNFNPFINIDDDVYTLMKNNSSQSLAMTFDAYNLLDSEEFKGIIDNILLRGLPKVQEDILQKVKGEL